MEIQKEQVGDIHVVTATGRLDGIYSSAFANQVGELLTGTNPKVLIDFTDIRGAAGPAAACEEAKGSGSVFALCGLNEQVREVLDISEFTSMFSIHSGRAEGIAALQHPATGATERGGHAEN